MSDINVNATNTSADVEASAPVQPTSQNATTAGNAAVANASKKDFSMDTKVDSMKSLKEEAPEVYKKMMEGIAMSVISSMRKRQERLKQMWREDRMH